MFCNSSRRVILAFISAICSAVTCPCVIHFADLQDEVFPRLFVGEAVHLVHRPRNGDAGVEGLVIEWHLELQSCVGTVLQGMSHIVGIAVS